MTATDPQPSPGPYATAAGAYWAAGFRGILPLPPRAKKSPPDGYTGGRGLWPSYPDVQAWIEDKGHGNIALRLPPNVIGVDVDHYDSKPGGLIFGALETQLGALPPTWRTTSRDDGISGIRLYTIPEGLRWPSVLGPGIEVIRSEHRYAVAWPSIHPDTGGTYRWITPEGATALGAVPAIETLPPLPDAWVEHFTRGEAANDEARADLTTTAANQWLTDRGAGTPCDRTAGALERAHADLLTGTSRHDAALSATNRLIWLAGEGHTGGLVALHSLRDAFLKATSGDRAQGDAEAEWDRMTGGAVRIAAAAHPDPSNDPCDDPFAGLIPRKDNPWKAPQPTSTTKTVEASPTTSTASQPPSSSSSATPETATTSTPAGQTENPSSDTDTQERTSWWPRDIDSAISGENPEPPPAFLHRDDGHAMFYKGRVNGIIGPSESGKTWVALQAVVDALAHDVHVTFLDFEDSERGVIGRLLALGVQADTIRHGFRYINPDEPFAQIGQTGLDLLEHLDTWLPELVILDGFNAAMTMQGLDLLSNMDATKFSRSILKPLTRNNACVVYIDHVPKSKDNTASGGIGAQAKRADTTGATLRVDPVKVFGKGQDGKLRVYVDKDRQGDVRGVSAPSNGTHWAADVNITSNAEGGIRVHVVKPEGFDTAAATYTFRPTRYMEQVSNWLVDNARAGRNEIIAGVGGRDKHVKDALKLLIEEGWVGVEKDGQRHHHTVLEAYTETAELLGTVASRKQNDAPDLPENALYNWGPEGAENGVSEMYRGARVNWGPTGGPAPGVLGATGCTSYPVPQSHGPQSGQNLIEREIQGNTYYFDPATKQQVNPNTGEVI